MMNAHLAIGWIEVVIKINREHFVGKFALDGLRNSVGDIRNIIQLNVRVENLFYDDLKERLPTVNGDCFDQLDENKY
jgi:hypothetical protein